MEKQPPHIMENMFEGEIPMELNQWECIEGKLHKLKIGEIFQFSDSTMSLTCTNCTQEFQYFTEFSLHIQEHYVRGEIVPLNEIKEEMIDDASNSEIQSMKMAPTEIDEDFEMQDNSASLLPELNCEVIDKEEFHHFDFDAAWSDDDFDANAHSIFDCEPKREISADKHRQLQFIDGTDYEMCNERFKCLTCDHESAKWKYFKEHLITHTTPKDVKCPICSKLFASVSYVRKHCSRTHNVRVSASKIKEAQSGQPFDIAALDRPKEAKIVYTEGVDYEKVDQKFQCITCRRIMAKFDHMKEHLLTHNSEKNVYCPFCARAFITESYVRKHVNRTHKMKITADEIKIAQASIDLTQIKNQWTIEKDKMAAKANRKLQQSAKQATAMVAADASTNSIDLTVSCFFCAKRFTKARYAQKHMRLIHAKPYTIAEVLDGHRKCLRSSSGKSFESPTVTDFVKQKTEPSDQYDDVQSEKSFECFECHKKFVSITSLRIHLKLHSGIKYYCPHCDKLFAMKSYVRDHIVIMHGIKRDDIPKESILQATGNIVSMQPANVIASYECYLCKNQYKKRNRLREHMQIHFDGPYLCVICGAVYKSTDTLRHHMEKHKSEQPVQCPQCDKTYPTRRYMLSHYRTIHLNKRPSPKKKEQTTQMVEVKCQICEKKFQSLHNLRQHMTVHNRDPNELICHICGWEFKERSNLKQHMESHGNNKTNCEVCNKILTIRYLQEHMKIHTGNKDFQCSTCGKQFVSRERLKRHMVRHNGEPKFKCDLCPKAYTRSDKLLYHRRTHEQQMTHQCQRPNCGKGFFSIKSLRKHENKHYLEDNGILKSEALAYETKIE